MSAHTESRVSKEDTRARLLDAAGRLFSEHGYEAVTIRQICHAAAANVAAVNYHFRDKQTLYTEVVKSIVQFPKQALEAATDRTPEEQLRQFIARYLEGLLQPEGPAWGLRLVQLELTNPTPALAHVVEAVIRPTERGLRNIIASITGDEPDAERVRLCTHSIIGQCLHYRHAEPIFNHLWPDLWAEPRRLEILAEHITNFSLCALERIKESAKPKED